jgi:hypothetical protein
VARPIIWSIAALWVCAGIGLTEESPDQKGPGFISLLRGDDLTGWEVRNGRRDAWQVDGEVLSCAADGGGWLCTSRFYSDFVLRLEYRIPGGGNSGVGLRLPREGGTAHGGIEIRILDDDHEQFKDLAPSQYTGGIDDQAAARRGVARPPEEWNTYEITCRGPQVKVVLNGEMINEVSLDERTTGDKGQSALADRPQTGAIGLHCHGSRVDFRRISIKDLTTATRSGVGYVDVVAGKGSTVAPHATVVVHYTGRLVDGRKFISTRDQDPPKPAIESLDDLIVGLQEGIPGMKVGGRRKLVIPPKAGYGDRPRDRIPADSLLIFDVEVLEVR